MTYILPMWFAENPNHKNIYRENTRIRNKKIGKMSIGKNLARSYELLSNFNLIIKHKYSALSLQQKVYIQQLLIRLFNLKTELNDEKIIR